MKDSKFIELLNLYVDHQISAADAALLEVEIQQNPKRHQVYRQYCQMQKACALLTDQFRSEAPTAETAQIIEFKPRHRSSTWIYASGMVAAAACVALVLLVNRSDRSAPAQQAQSVAVAPAIQTPTPVAALPVLQPVFNGLGPNAAAAVATNERVPLDWMTRVQFERMPAQSLRFDSPQALPADDLVFRSQRVFDVKTEGAAFRFQR